MVTMFYWLLKIALESWPSEAVISLKVLFKYVTDSDTVKMQATKNKDLQIP